MNIVFSTPFSVLRFTNSNTGWSLPTHAVFITYTKRAAKRLLSILAQLYFRNDKFAYIWKQVLILGLWMDHNAFLQQQQRRVNIASWVCTYFLYDNAKIFHQRLRVHKMLYSFTVFHISLLRVRGLSYIKVYINSSSFLKTQNHKWYKLLNSADLELGSCYPSAWLWNSPQVVVL